MEGILVFWSIAGLVVAVVTAAYLLKDRRDKGPDPVLQEAELMARRRGAASFRLGEPRSLEPGGFRKGLEDEQRQERATHAALPYRFSITIQLPLGPLERAERFENPLTEALGDFGVVLGGGTVSRTIDGQTVILEVGFSIRVKELEGGLALLRKTLIAQGAPKDTRIDLTEPEEREFTLDSGR